MNLSCLRHSNIKHIWSDSPLVPVCTQDSMKWGLGFPPVEGSHTEMPSHTRRHCRPSLASRTVEAQRELVTVNAEGFGWRWHLNGNSRHTLLCFIKQNKVKKECREERERAVSRRLSTSSRFALYFQPYRGLQRVFIKYLVQCLKWSRCLVKAWKTS